MASHRVFASLAVGLFFLSTLLGSSVVADDGGADAQAVEPWSRWNVGLTPVPRELSVGDAFHGGEVIRINRVLNFITVVASDPGFWQTATDDPEVVYVEPDHLRTIEYTPNDPSYSSQYGPQKVRADLVWATSLGTTDKNVCIVDTGVRYTHEDLTGTRWLGGYDFVNGDSNPWDDQGHGTHVAGIAAASTDNGKGMAGVAQVGIKAAKVLNSAGQGYDSWVADGIEWCADNGGHVINLSLGGPAGSTTLSNAVNYAWNEGMVVVAAAGNDGPCSNCVNYPARYVNAIAVSCTTSSDSQCSFSSDGPQVDLSAPGYDIYATCYGSNTNYCRKSGTSMSAPHVAGVAALVWSLAPHSTNVKIRELLEDNARDIGASGWDQFYGWGVVDAKAALDAVTVIHPQDPILTDDFDDGAANGFTLGGMWRVSSVCGGAASAPNYLGYHQASSCSYANGISSTSGSAHLDVDLSDMLQATLKFKHRWETESNGDGAYDIMRVEVSTNGGSTWTSLLTWDSRDGNQASWQEETILLNDVVGTTARVRFFFDSVDGMSNAFDGWHIDDLVVTATDNFPPVAHAGPDRSAVDADGTGAESVSFDGTGSHDLDDGGTIVSYEWHLGTTLLGTGAAPTLSVPVGTNTVTLTVTDDGGDIDTDTVTVNVAANTPPIASAGTDITTSDADNDGAALVVLDGSGSGDSDGTIASYAWTQEGTAVATGVGPSVALPVGTHTLTLTVTDNGGATAMDTVQVTVNANLPPTASAGPDLTASDGNADGAADVVLDGSGSTDPDGTITSYAWSTGGAPLAGGVSPTVSLPLGTHLIDLQVTDDGGATSTSSVSVLVEANHAPVADPGADFAVRDIGADGVEPVTLDGTASADDDGTITLYEWHEGATPLGTGATLTTDLAFGSHTITLTVTDDGGATASTDVVVSVVDDVPPTAAFTATCNGRDCTFDGGPSTDDGSIVQYAWTFGDGFGSSGPAATATHLYASVGSYDVCLTVTDDGDNTGQHCTNVLIENTYQRFDFDDGTAGGMSTTGMWHVDSSCTTPRSAPSYLGYHSSSCTMAQWSAHSGDAKFTVDLSSNTDPVLDFWHRWDTHKSGINYHRQYVQARPVGTSSWTTLAQWTSSNPDQPTWLNTQLDLAAYAGGSVEVRFRFESSSSSWTVNNQPGWHVDWIQVGEADQLVFPPTPPIAVAGSDVTVRDLDGTGAEAATLDGTGSSDPGGGTLVAYEWREGGTVLGTSATLTRPFTVGTHTVTLTITDNEGLTDTDSAVVTVVANQPPVARAGSDATLQDADGDGVETRHLDGSASTDDGPIQAYTWTLGGEVLGTGPTLDAALAVGQNVITLDVTDLGGVTTTDTVTVTVIANEPPVAVAGPDIERNDDDRDGTESIALDGSASFDPVGDIVAWEWTSNGEPIGSGEVLVHGFGWGVHDVELTVHDASGATDSDGLQVTITNNRPPTADFTFVCDVVACDFDAGLSDDPDGDPLTYAWDFGDGAASADAAVWHAFPHAGFFNVCLTVADWGFEDAKCQTVHLIATTFFDDFDDGATDGWTRTGLWKPATTCTTPPSGAYYLGFHQSFVCVYQELTASAGAATFGVDLREATTAKLEIDHRWHTESTSGNTARDVMRIQASRNGGSTWYTLKEWDSRDLNQIDWGAYTVNLDGHVGYDLRLRFHFDTYNQLYNHYQGWHIDNVDVVSDAPAPNKAPAASFTATCNGASCSFDGSGSADFPGGVLVDHAWDFGDGTTGSGETVSHTYAAAGTYTVTLTVTDNGGMSDSDSTNVMATG